MAAIDPQAFIPLATVTSVGSVLPIVDAQDNEEARFMHDLVGLRDCPGPVTLVIANDGTRKPLFARSQKRCGQPYGRAWRLRGTPGTPDFVLRAFACERCADNLALKALLAIGAELDLLKNRTYCRSSY